MLPRDVTDNAAMFPMVNQIYKEFQVRKKNPVPIPGFKSWSSVPSPSPVFLTGSSCSESWSSVLNPGHSVPYPGPSVSYPGPSVPIHGPSVSNVGPVVPNPDLSVLNPGPSVPYPG